MKVQHPLHTTGFDTVLDDEKKDLEKTVKYIICAIIYFKISNKAIFADLKKYAKNDYVLSKEEYVGIQLYTNFWQNRLNQV